MIKVNVLGSCVSRICMLNGDTTLHGIYGDEMELGYFLDKQNLALAMLAAPFSPEEVEAIDPECLYDKSRIRALRQCLNKTTVNMLMESDAEYLVMDLYDFHNDFLSFGDTAFSTCAHEFCNTELFTKQKEKFHVYNFMHLPSWIWYGYVDLFFEKIMEKYDADHIILMRFRSNKYYQCKDGLIRRLPDEFKQPYHSNDKYNEPLARLEDYVISKYHPYVGDLSRYYVCDENMWTNLNGAHFEKEYYQDGYRVIREIIVNKSKQRCWDTPAYLEQGMQFAGMKEKGYAFDVEQALQLLPLFVETGDDLWMNLLAKLHTYAPENEQVQAYLQACLGEE